MRLILLPCFLLFAFVHVALGQRSTNRRSNLSLEKSWHAQASDAQRGSAPANDDCANAQAITIAADCAAPISGTTFDATQDGSAEPVCDTDAGPYLDVWYTFNSGVETSVWITLTPITAGMDFAFTLQEGCTGAEVFCVALPGSALEIPVIAGTDYVVRVYSNEFYGPPGDFELCVSTDVIIAPPPPNDVCTDVTPQPVAIGGTATYNGDNTGATSNEGLPGNLVWEAFTLSTCADVKIDFCGTTPRYGNFWLLIYTDCTFSQGIWNGSYDSTACSDQNFTVCYANLQAGTYYVPIVQNVFATGPYTLHVSATACGTEQASNDECTGAIPLTANASCQPSTFSNTCATESLPAMLCDGSQGLANDDVWYSFVATDTDMSVGGAPNGSMDIALQLFSGTCGSLTPIDCADLAGAGGVDDLQASGLTVGTTYYLRVYDWDNGYAFEDPSYELCVVEGLGSGVGLDEEEGTGNGSIHPNPNDGAFTIRLKNTSKAVQVDVIDAAGRTVSSTTPIASSGRVQVDASQLPQGAYVVRYADGAHLFNERLIIQ